MSNLEHFEFTHHTEYVLEKYFVKKQSTVEDSMEGSPEERDVLVANKLSLNMLCLDS